MAQRLHKDHRKLTQSYVKKQRLNPDPPVGFEGEIPNDGYSIQARCAYFLGEWSKLVNRPGAFCEEGLFWRDRENLDPDALEPFVFNAAYDDVCLQEHYKQSSRMLKDWLQEAYQKHPETL